MTLSCSFLPPRLLHRVWDIQREREQVKEHGRTAPRIVTDSTQGYVITSSRSSPFGSRSGHLYSRKRRRCVTAMELSDPAVWTSVLFVAMHVVTAAGVWLCRRRRSGRAAAALNGTLLRLHVSLSHWGTPKLQTHFLSWPFLFLWPSRLRLMLSLSRKNYIQGYR